MTDERAERVRLAEEARDVDQQILVEAADLARVGLQHLQVLRHVAEAVQRHAAVDAPGDGGALVIVEVDARGASEQLEDAAPVGASRWLPGIQVSLVRRGSRLAEKGVRRQPHQLIGDLVGRQRRVHGAGGHRGPWHAVDLRFVR